MEAIKGSAVLGRLKAEHVLFSLDGIFLTIVIIFKSSKTFPSILAIGSWVRVAVFY